VDAHDLLARHGEHAERVVRTQVVLRREREPAQVVERAAIVRVDAAGGERLAIEADALVRVPQAPLQALELQRLELVPRGRLDRLEVACLGSEIEHGLMRHCPRDAPS